MDPSGIPITDWITALAAVATLFLAVVAIWVTRQQNATSRNQLRSDLFDRRFAVHEAVQQFLGEMLGRVDEVNESISRLNQATRGVEFLFEPEIRSYLRTLVDKALDLKYAALLARREGSPLQNPNDERAHELQLWFASQLGSAELLFRPYLEFGDFRAAKRHSATRWARAAHTQVQKTAAEIGGPVVSLPLDDQPDAEEAARTGERVRS